MLDLKSIKKSSIRDTLSSFIQHSFDYTRHSQACPILSDFDFFMNAFERIFSSPQSGREFLQVKGDSQSGEDLAKSTFFDSLHSKRRLAMTKDVAGAFQRLLSRLFDKFSVDYLSDFPELKEYRVLAGDGHYIDHGCHSKRDAKGKVYAAGTIYTQDLRTGLLSVLDVVTDGKRKSHEIPIFRNAVEAMANQCDQKTLWILDRAYVDKTWWPRQKNKGHHVIVRLKENNRLQECGDLNFDPQKDINAGVTRYYLAGIGNSSAAQRIIEYTDPETGQEYKFVTTLSDMPPGLIASLYFLRWRIEKSFDICKNTFLERKAWATGKVALEIQSHMISMAYNFLRFIKEFLQEEEGIEDLKVVVKYNKDLVRREKKASENGRQLHPFLKRMKRMHRLSTQFIRVIKNHFLQLTPFCRLTELFRQRMDVYL